MERWLLPVASLLDKPYQAGCTCRRATFYFKIILPSSLQTHGRHWTVHYFDPPTHPTMQARSLIQRLQWRACSVARYRLIHRLQWRACLLKFFILELKWSNFCIGMSGYAIVRPWDFPCPLDSYIFLPRYGQRLAAALGHARCSRQWIFFCTGAARCAGHYTGDPPCIGLWFEILAAEQKALPFLRRSDCCHSIPGAEDLQRMRRYFPPAIFRCDTPLQEAISVRPTPFVSP